MSAFTKTVRPAAVAAAGLALALTGMFGFAGAASADPIVAPGETLPRVLNATGSDTLQDGMNGVANSVTDPVSGKKALSSWDATGTSTITTTANAFKRPNGSTDGIIALSSAVSGLPGTWGGQTDTLARTEVNVARSSSSIGSGMQDNNGPLLYLPWAVDAVTYATSSNTVIPSGIPLTATNPAGANGTKDKPFGLSLTSIYGGVGHIQGALPGTTSPVYKFYVGTGTPASGFTKLDVYVPQEGSGTREFFGTKVGQNFKKGVALPAGVTDKVGGVTPVQEHNGSALVGNNKAIVPFSIAQHLAQTNAAAATPAGQINGVPVADRRSGALLNKVGTALPTKVDPITGKTVLNSAFPINRTVYNVVERDALIAQLTPGVPNPKYNATLAAVFGSGGSAYNKPQIQDFGFGISGEAGKDHTNTPSLRAKLRLS